MLYRYKGKIPDEKFDKYDNALNLINERKNGEIKLTKAKNDQIIFKLNLGEIKKGNNKKRSKKQNKKKKKTHYKILTCFAKQETRLLIFLTNILQW